jgi:dipeptidyl aminopeptidase/acylaminoacyl peptidase
MTAAQLLILRILALFLAFALCGCGKSHDTGYLEVLDELLAQYPTPVSASPNGELILAKTRHETDFEVLVLSRNSGQPIAHDRSPDTQLSLTWSPEGQAFAFQESPGGNRQYGLYLFDLLIKKRRQLDAPVTETAAFPLRWNPAGTRIAYFCVNNERRAIELIPVARAGVSASALELNSEPGDFVWSPDGKELAVSLPGSIAIFNVNDGGHRDLDLPPNAEVGELAWSPDGSSILAAVRSVNSEFHELVEIDAASGVHRLRVSAPGDIARPLWLPNRQSLVYHVNSQGKMLRIAPDSQGRSVFLPDVPLPGCQVQGFDPIRDKAFVLSKPPSAPPTLLEASFDGSKPSILYSAPQLMPARPGVPPEFVEFPSFDGTAIHALAWRSPLTSPNCNAVLIEVHGGPHIQATAEWDAGKQLLLRKGVNLLSVDYRGSTGYGAAFAKAEDMLEQAKDVLAARDYAARTFRCFSSAQAMARPWSPRRVRKIQPELVGRFSSRFQARIFPWGDAALVRLGSWASRGRTTTFALPVALGQ